MYPPGEKRFLLINHITIIALFVLILAGGIVRSSGSGMGCPDWPKCFGSIVPPVNASQLPVDYQDKYLKQRIAKNERFAKTLDVFGYGELAARIRNDKTLMEAEEFNAAKTWTEYVNRLIGAITGFLLLACVLLSINYLKTRKRIFFLSVINVVLVGFQAWLGSIVVSTNLLAWVVTVHMLLALLIVAISIYTYFHARILRDQQILTNKPAGILRLIAIFSLALMLIQITIGTEVREQIDAIASFMNNLNRSEWVSKVGLNFDFHKDLAVGVLISAIVVFYLVRRGYISNRYQLRYASYVLLLVFLQIIIGVSLSYMALPPVSQAMHLTLASLMFGAQYYLVLLLKRNNYTLVK
ncbi:MAG TPA: heme A synthase [Sphingobacteriaceae bacterium]|nr:heme A synthase [Sphingobacteriaceae bacterium]